MANPRERLAQAGLDRRTEGFLFRALEEYEPFIGLRDFVPLTLEEGRLVEGEKEMKDKFARSTILSGLKYLEEICPSAPERRALTQSRETLELATFAHTYFGDVPEMMDRIEELRYIQPQPVPDETPYFAVAEGIEGTDTFVVVPELWLGNVVSEDSNQRIEAISLLAMTTAYVYGYTHQNEIKADIIKGLARAIFLPQPDGQEEFRNYVENIFVRTVERSARANVKDFLTQGADQIKTGGFSLSEGMALGFPEGLYVPTNDFFRKLYYEG